MTQINADKIKNKTLFCSWTLIRVTVLIEPRVICTIAYCRLFEAMMSVETLVTMQSIQHPGTFLFKCSSPFRES